MCVNLYTDYVQAKEMPLPHRSPVTQGTYEFEGNQRTLSVLVII